jgi:hypothetical protein
MYIRGGHGSCQHCSLILRLLGQFLASIFIRVAIIYFQMEKTNRIANLKLKGCGKQKYDLKAENQSILIFRMHKLNTKLDFEIGHVNEP